MKPLADKVLENQKSENGKVNFFPARFEHTLNTWMENVHDWCNFSSTYGGDTVFLLGTNKETGEKVMLLKQLLKIPKLL